MLWSRRYLLNYFGEEFPRPCSYCDNCERGIVVEENEADMPFPFNSKVMHKTWGEGIVVRYEGDKMVVLFESVGYKMLSIDIVQERDLLTGK
jgi:ATP-dependent DNA helicase RecQ